MPDPYQNLLNFINLEKLFFKEFYPAINWDNNKWPMHIIFPNWKRSKTTNISFTPITKGGLKIDGFNNPSIKEIIPKNINDTIKAILSFIIRTKNIQANSATTYQLVLLGLYHVMFSRNEKEFMNINNDYFNFLEIYYKKHYDPNNAYNICQYLSYIGKLFDKHRLTTKKIMYTPRLKRGRNPHNTPKKFREDGPHEKELTREAIEALAVILNSPDSEGQEVLFKAILLLFATGMRGNEVSTLPYDCIINRSIFDHKTGKEIKDQNGRNIKTFGIKYFPEKKAEPKVLYLDKFAAQIAEKCINEIKILTRRQRQIAKYQSDNPGRLFPLPPDTILRDDELLEYIPYNSNDSHGCPYRQLSNRRGNLRKCFMKKHKIKEAFTIKEGRTTYYYYRISDIEQGIYNSGKYIDFITNDVGLAKKNGKIILKKHEMLILPEHGSHRLKNRKNNNIKIFVRPMDLTLLNNLTSINTKNSETTIFEQRGYTEADGSPTRKNLLF